jgi:hypothetical protein
MTHWFICRNVHYQNFTFRLKCPYAIRYEQLSRKNQSIEGAEFVWVSECQNGEGCEVIKHFFCIVPPMLSSVLIVVDWQH